MLLRPNVRVDEYRPAEPAAGDPVLLAVGGWRVVAGVTLRPSTGSGRSQATAGACTAPRWQSVNAGAVVVTDRRILVGGERGRPIWLAAIRDLAVDLRRGQISLHVDGHPPVRIAGPDVPSVAVLLVHLVRGEALPLPPRPVTPQAPPPPPPSARPRRLRWLVG